jgi:hypothetical protein
MKNEKLKKSGEGKQPPAQRATLPTSRDRLWPLLIKEDGMFGIITSPLALIKEGEINFPRGS